MLARADAIAFLMQHVDREPIVANLGINAADLFAVRDRPQNLYLWGSMGLTAAIGLGIALAQPQQKVFVLDGDGSLLMNLGVLPTIADQAPKNLVHIVLDNEEWAETGHQPTHTGRVTDLAAVARGAGISRAELVDTQEGFERALSRALAEDGPWCIVAKIEKTGKLGPLPPTDADGIVLRFREALER